MKVRRKVEYEMNFHNGDSRAVAKISEETGILHVDMGVVMGNATLLSSEVVELVRFIREHHPAFQETRI